MVKREQCGHIEEREQKCWERWREENGKGRQRERRERSKVPLSDTEDKAHGGVPPVANTVPEIHFVLCPWGKENPATENTEDQWSPFWHTDYISLLGLPVWQTGWLSQIFVVSEFGDQKPDMEMLVPSEGDSGPSLFPSFWWLAASLRCSFVPALSPWSLPSFSHAVLPVCASPCLLLVRIPVILGCTLMASF